MTPEEINNEIKKCKESPYYFATTYLTITSRAVEVKKFTTRLTEEEFNKQIKSYESRTNR